MSAPVTSSKPRSITRRSRRYSPNALARANGCPEVPLIPRTRIGWTKLYTVRGRLAWECNSSFFARNFTHV